jgi:hypothetical protein
MPTQIRLCRTVTWPRSVSDVLQELQEYPLLDLAHAGLLRFLLSVHELGEGELRNFFVPDQHSACSRIDSQRIVGDFRYLKEVFRLLDGSLWSSFPNFDSNFPIVFIVHHSYR